MSQSVDLVQQSRILVRILNFIGIWPNADQLNYKRFIRLAMWHLPTTFLYTTLMWYDAIKSPDIDYLTGVLYIVLTETVLWVKIFTITQYAPMAYKMLQDWQYSSIYTLHTREEKDMWQKSQRAFGIMSFCYIFFSMIAVFGAFTSVIFKGYTVLPIPFWVPFDWHKPFNFWCAYIYELIAMPISGCANMTLDMLNCYLIYHNSLIYRLVGLRLAHFLWQEDKPLSDEHTEKRLIHLIQLHQLAIKQTENCEKVVSKPIVTQIILSSFVICFSILKIKNQTFSEDPGTFITLLQYSMVMSFQIFLPCFYCNKITDNAKNNLFQAYSCNWTNLSLKNRRLLLIFMQYLNKPVILHAGLFFEIHLPLFLSVMQNSYNLLALMLNVR